MDVYNALQILYVNYVMKDTISWEEEQVVNLVVNLYLFVKNVQVHLFALLVVMDTSWMVMYVDIAVLFFKDVHFVKYPQFARIVIKDFS